MSDTFYRQFEEKYRGPRELIKTRLAAYMPFLTPLVAKYPAAAALDLGCGRGEWLELLTEIGLTPFGVDLDNEMLSGCQALGLDIRHGDALSHLASLPDNSQIIVSAFHLVEHISFEQLRALVADALRVLMPGGLLIMETPNPENIVVATSSFYLDPTHNRPVPPLLLSFVPEYYGFERVKTIRLQEAPHVSLVQALTLYDVLGGASQDYAVVAQKKAERVDAGLLDAAFAEEYGISTASLAARYALQTALTARQADETLQHVAQIAGQLQEMETRSTRLQEISERAAHEATKCANAAEIVSMRAANIERLALKMAADAERMQNEAQIARADAERMRNEAHIARADAERMRNEAHIARADAENSRMAVYAMHASRSWRITQPLRWFGFQARLLREHGFAARGLALFKRIVHAFTGSADLDGSDLPNHTEHVQHVIEANASAQNPAEVEAAAEQQALAARLESLTPSARAIYDQLKVAVRGRQDAV